MSSGLNRLARLAAATPKQFAASSRIRAAAPLDSTDSTRRSAQPSSSGSLERAACGSASRQAASNGSAPMYADRNPGGRSARLHRLDETVCPTLLVRVAGKGCLWVRLSPGSEQRLCPDVCLETPGASAAAAPSSGNDAVVAPLPGTGRSAPVERSVGEDGRSDASAPKGDHGVMCAATRAEPHLHLPQRFGTVLSKDRSSDALSHQALEGNALRPFRAAVS